MDYEEIARMFSGSDVPHEIHFHDVHDNNIENYYAGGQEKGNRNNYCDSTACRNDINSIKLSDNQQILFEKAVSAGLMSRLPDGHYHWLSSKALLSYFCGRVFCGDRPMVGCDGKIVWEFGGGTFPTAAVEWLFGVKGRDTYRRHRNMLSVPQDHGLVDNLWT